MGHQNIEAEIYTGRRSSKEAYKVTKCLLLMLFYIPKENKSAVLSNEIKLSNALQAIRGGKKVHEKHFLTEITRKHLL